MVKNGPGATTVVVGTVVYPGGASVVLIIPFATGTFRLVKASDGTDVTSVIATTLFGTFAVIAGANVVKNVVSSVVETPVAGDDVSVKKSVDTCKDTENVATEKDKVT